MSFVLEDGFDLGLPIVGELRTGQVVAHRNNVVMIDIGAKSEAVISSAELDKMDALARQALAVGNEVSVYVINPENQDGEIVVSYTKAIEEKDWDLARELLESAEIYDCQIVGSNKGGLLTKVGLIRGFVPASQLTISRQLRNATNSEDLLRQYIGRRIQTKVIEVDRSRNRLILSERAAEKEARAARRAALLERLQEGDVLEGVVVNLADFGAFVDIGGMEGLVHISELSWKRATRPSDVLQVGQKVTVKVLNVDQKRQRVALSTRRMEPDPWSLILDRYHVGQLVAVSVTKLTDYGAFARLADDEYDFEGLIHISELSEEHIKHPSQVVRKGEAITARIIRIDPERKQIGLSLKQVMSSRYMDADLAWAEVNQATTEEE